MKTNKLTFGMIAIAALLAGCNNDENEGNGGKDGRVAINVESTICTLTSGSRATGTDWAANDAIGIFMMNGATADTYENVPYVTEAGDGAFTPQETTVYLPTEDGATRSFVAYYPYQSSMGSSTYVIDLSDQTDQSAIDFMVADKENGDNSVVENISKTAPDVEFYFHHVLCKLSMTISAGKGLEDSDLEGMEIELTGQHAAGQMDVLTGTEVSTTDDADQTITLLTAENGQSAEAIVMPSENYSDMSFVFKTTDKGDYKWSLSDASESENFSSGNQYTYTITINETGINVTSSIAPWEAGNGDGEEVSAE